MSEAVRSYDQQWRRALRRCRRLCWKSVVWFVIASAVLVSIGRLLAPYADLLRPQIERILAERLERPVRIERIEASWPRLSPRLTLYGVRVGEDDPRLLGVDRARLEFKLYNLLRPAANVVGLVVLGLEVAVIQNPQGRWSWQLDRGGRLAEGWADALAAGDLVLRDAGVRVVPHGLPQLRWTISEARLGRAGSELGVRLQAMPAGGEGPALTGRARMRVADQRVTAFEAHARMQPLPMSALLPVPGDATGSAYRAAGQVWLNGDGDGVRVHAQLDPRPSGDAPTMAGGALTLDGYWRPGSIRVRLDADDAPAAPSPLTGLVYAADRSGFALAAERIDLAYLDALLAPWLRGFSEWPRRLEGVATDMRWVHRWGHGPRALNGRIEDLAFATPRPAVSVARLDLDLALAGDEVRVALGGAPMLELPTLYPDAREFRRVAGTVGVRAGRLRFDAVRLFHDAFEARIDGDVQRADDSEVVDLVIDLPRLSPASPRRWLPLKGLPEKTRGWLDDALLGVERGEAAITLFGRPRDWPERVPPGAVDSRIEFSGLRLAYARGWPVAEDIDGRVAFVGETMRAAAERGRVAGVTLRAPEVRIDDTRRAEIELSLEAPATGAGRLADLADALPLPGADAALAAMSWSGTASARARIWFPVRHREDWRLVGEIGFDGAAVSFSPPGLQLRRIEGVLPFSRDRLGPANFDARVGERPLALALDARFGPDFRLDVEGSGPVPEMLPDDWLEAYPPLRERLEGRSRFSLSFGSLASEDAAGPTGVRIASDLQGLASTFPAPLDKPAETARAFELTIPLDNELYPLRFAYGERLDGIWLRSGDYWQLGLALGGGEADLPAAENFIVEGEVDRLALDGWTGLLGADASAGADGSGELSGWLDLRVADLRAGGGSLGAVDAALNRDGEYWRMNIMGERVQGSVRAPAGRVGDGVIVLDLARLHLPVPADAGGDPSPPSGRDPRVLPAFDIAIRDLRRGELDLGEFRLNSHREDEGIRIEQVSSRRQGFELAGEGAWLAGSDGPYTTMRLRTSTGDLGRALTQAGYDIALERGNAVIEMQGRWPGSPLDLALQRFDGTMDLVISDGAIPEASPGAGRVLGLVSLNAIPRRLRLDFTDVFGEGLVFDRAAGHFDLSGGVASTEDLRIDAPAAEIRVRGKTDLRARTYDQTLIVRPGVSSALPIIGALAGGPVGAAAGAALQQIFSEPLKGISEIRYAVDGTWSEPQIRPVAVEPVRDEGG